MCALYSTLNACKYLLDHSERSDNRLFKHLCEQTIPDLFPKIMVEGAGTDGVRRLLTGAAQWVREAHHRDLEWSAPVWRRDFATAPAWFRFLRDTLREGDDEGRVVIVGLNKPWNHWTVLVGADARTAYFFDSWGLPDSPFTDFTFDKSKAGDGDRDKTLIDYHQTFLVRLPKR